MIAAILYSPKLRRAQKPLSMPYLVLLAGSNPVNLSEGLEKLLRYASFSPPLQRKCKIAVNQHSVCVASMQGPRDNATSFYFKWAFDKKKVCMIDKYYKTNK